MIKVLRDEDGVPILTDVVGASACDYDPDDEPTGGCCLQPIVVASSCDPACLDTEVPPWLLKDGQLVGVLDDSFIEQTLCTMVAGNYDCAACKTIEADFGRAK